MGALFVCLNSWRPNGSVSYRNCDHEMALVGRAEAARTAGTFTHAR